MWSKIIQLCSAGEEHLRTFDTSIPYSVLPMGVCRWVYARVPRPATADSITSFPAMAAGAQPGGGAFDLRLENGFIHCCCCCCCC